ncbi:Gfo/Idh/MocA family protein [Actinomadura macrotermitis]|uniref:Inositol 2-dehydrogenase/D-chiro-inositol 3-dehydrogenase n=1 Tax=Actinomadura macrotermitis TaxID=2585200 RepID=A0A7K0C2X5_9ACTN|nr:Gfo/Idh/MocA family oxidoreductase [Actinomadura macrotermitis]MQY07768.1 Inositol 2-dehydrogenase/D-chiro-inositol 3-dehydrogenase [Actinomadura macrotermitis]
MRIGLAGAGRIGARHAAALSALPETETLIVADADPARAHGLAARLTAAAGGHDPARAPEPASPVPVRAGSASAGSAPAGSAGSTSIGPVPAGPLAAGAGRARVVAVDDVAELFGQVDALVVAAATDAHADLVRRGVAAAIPVFCEKPLAADLDGTFHIMAAAAADAGVPVQVGFQRRFDAGYVAAREAVASGRLGRLHTLRSCGLDPAPPPAAYVPTSGGLFRDCLIHDLDSVRYVTGRSVVQVMAVGANLGDAVFRECGDVDTGAALLVLDDGALCLLAATRYNAAGYDVRLELFGSRDSVVAGLDERTPVTPLPGGGPAASPYTGFLDRFAAAYDAELRAFVEVAAGERPNPCPPEEALEAFYLAEACELARREGRAVDPREVRR